MRVVAALFLTLALTGFARADVLLKSAVPGKLDVSYKLPSGEAKTSSVYPGSPLGVGSLSGIPDGVKNLQVNIQDDMGSPVWSGSVHNNSTNLLFLADNGQAELKQVGWYVDAGQGYPAAVSVVNLTDEPVTLDFFGQSGSQGTSGQAALPGFNSTPIRLPQGEHTFRVVVHDASGTVRSPDYNPISAGRFMAVVSHEGKLVVVELGLLKPPPGSSY